MKATCCLCPILMAVSVTATAQPQMMSRGYQSPPDLVLSVMADRLQVHPGERLGVRVKLVNRGGGYTGGRPVSSQSVILVLSKDRSVPLPLSSRVPTGFREDSLLPGGERRGIPTPRRRGSWSGRITVTLPADVPPGRWWLCGVADPHNQLSESNERNNVSCKELLIKAAGRSAQGSASARQSSPPKEESKREETVVGNILRDILWGSADGQRPESHSKKKPSGKSAHREKEPFRERGRKGNRPPPASACGPRGGRLPDLQASAVKAPVHLPHGSRKPFAVWVENKGKVSAPPYDGRCGYQVHIVLSKRNGVELPRNGRYAPGVYVARAIRPDTALAPGKKLKATRDQRRLQVDSIPRGKYWLCVVADPYNGVRESNEANNSKCEYQVMVE